MLGRACFPQGTGDSLERTRKREMRKQDGSPFFLANGGGASAGPDRLGPSFYFQSSAVGFHPFRRCVSLRPAVRPQVWEEWEGKREGGKGGVGGPRPPCPHLSPPLGPSLRVVYIVRSIRAMPIPVGHRIRRSQEGGQTRLLPWPERGTVLLSWCRFYHLGGELGPIGLMRH